MLIVGVNDEGEILGLERDYASLEGTKDEFELHLRNLINQAFGKPFAASGLSVKFIPVSDKEICRIEISKSNRPIYLEINDNGKKIDKFYVRSGNSSQELGIKEVTEYLKTRFG